MLSAQLIRERAAELGFDLIGFAPAGPTPGAGAFVAWLTRDMHGEMAYLAREPHKRLDPRAVMPGARTVIVVGVSYDTLAVPMDVLRDPSRGRIARYAWGADYHDVITPKLRALGEFVSRESGASRAYVDTGPVLERAWAEAAGLGFIGKNTCLIGRKRGSYLFLGAILCGEELDEGFRPTPLPQPGCGACARCIAACPTQAIVAPHELDARRCISYLTIELRGAIPTELRGMMGNWIFGCDVCQDVCPYVRRFSAPTRWREFYPLDLDRAAPKLLDVLAWSRDEFNAHFRGSAVKRAKWRGLVRNACVAAGNWGSDEAAPTLRALAGGGDELVAEHARWALARIAS